MRFQRLALPIISAFMAICVALMGRALWNELQELSTAGNENAQWTIMQLDTEFANLRATLADQISQPEIDKTLIRLRTDIALSRIHVVERGVPAEIISSDETSRNLLADIQRFGDAAADIVDGDLGVADVERLARLTSEIAPFARRLSLRGVQIGAERTEARREHFAASLRNTGIVAMVVIAALAAVMIVLNRLFLDARRKDRELRASSRRLESTISGSFDAIISSDAAGTIMNFNPAAEKIFDWRKQDLTGSNVSILLAGWPRDRKAPDLAETGNAFETYLGRGRVEILARTRTGAEFPADVFVTTTGDVEGEQIVVYLRDISDQKMSEQALVAAKEEAERTDRAKSQFLTVMSHEMRTPLNGVMGVLELLRTTSLSERQLRYLDVASASGEVLMRQLHEALDVTRIETGALRLVPQRFNLAQEVGRVAAVLEPLANEKNISLLLRVEPGAGGDIVADGSRAGQIVTNLVGNAIKYTNKGSVEIVLSFEEDSSGSAANIVVKDTGIGIPEDQTDAIFEDYVALSRSSGRMSRSDGLGLSISRRLARMMGGDITVSSVEGQGSVFTFTLPLNGAEALQSSPQVIWGISDSGPDALGAKQVLIVEDNGINRTVLREMLEGMGVSVDMAVDGEEGFAIAQQRKYDLILMDIDMPKVDGVALTRRIREEDGPNRGTWVHGLTAYGEEEFYDLAKEAGMNGFTTKPIRMETLSRILASEPSRAPVAKTGNTEIDVVVLEELRAALGEPRFSDALRAFFDESESSIARLSEFNLPSDIKILRAELHKLSGAAALFGFRSITEGAASLGSDLEFGTTESFAGELQTLGALIIDARHRLASKIGQVMPT